MTREAQRTRSLVVAVLVVLCMTTGGVLLPALVLAQANGSAVQCNLHGAAAPTISAIATDTSLNSTKSRLACTKSLSQVLRSTQSADSVEQIISSYEPRVCGDASRTISIPATLRRDRLPLCRFTIAALATLTVNLDSLLRVTGGPAQPPGQACGAITAAADSTSVAVRSCLRDSSVLALARSIDALTKQLDGIAAVKQTLLSWLENPEVTMRAGEPLIVRVVPTSDTFFVVQRQGSCTWTCKAQWGTTIAVAVSIGVRLGRTM